MSENLRIAISIALVFSWCFWVALILWRNRSKVKFESGKALIAFASQTGQARASALAHSAKHNDALFLPLNKVTQRHLTSALEVHFYLSTYGDGEAPDNGRKFFRALNQFNHNAIKTVKFSVTAFGDSRYPDFCAFGKNVYQKLLHLGAQPLSPIQLIDSNDTNIEGSHLNQSTGFKPATILDLTCLNPKSDSPGLYQLLLSAPELTWQPGDLLEVSLPQQEKHYAPRTYSIATAASNKLTKKHLKLIVRLHINPDGSYGKASGFLTQECEVGSQIKIKVRENPACQLESEQKPLLLIGAGSGLAGILGHIEQRSFIKDAGPVWLIYGERNPKYDQPLSHQITNWQQQGIINRVDKTYSRQTESVRYVQDVLLKNPKEVKRFIDAQGDIYVCGSLEGMGKAVHQALLKIVGQQTITELSEAGRYHRDLY